MQTTQTQIPTTQFPQQGAIESTILPTRPAPILTKPCLESLALPLASTLGASKLCLEPVRTGEEETREDDEAPAVLMESTPLFGKDQESPLSMELPKKRLQKRRSKYQFPSLEYPDCAFIRRKYSLREKREAREPEEDLDSCGSIEPNLKCPNSQKMENRGGVELENFHNPTLTKPGRRTLCHRPRPFKRPLSINTEAEIESHCAAVAFSMNAAEMMSSKEKHISEFLSKMDIQAVCFKELVEQGSKFTSKRVQEMFRTKRSLDENDSPTSVNFDETSTPQRRREKKSFEKKNSAIGRLERLSKLSMDLSEVTFQYKPE